MENGTMMGDPLRQTDLPEREMINRDKHGAVVELAEQGTPKKATARMLGVSIKSVHRILKHEEWKPYRRQPPAKVVQPTQPARRQVQDEQLSASPAPCDAALAGRHRKIDQDH